MFEETEPHPKKKSLFVSKSYGSSKNPRERHMQPLVFDILKVELMPLKLRTLIFYFDTHRFFSTSAHISLTAKTNETTLPVVPGSFLTRLCKKLKSFPSN